MSSSDSDLDSDPSSSDSSPATPYDHDNLPITHAAALEIIARDPRVLDGRQRRDRYKELTCNLPIQLGDNVPIAEYRLMPTSAASFTLFPKLPPETRSRIWQWALSWPRVLELEKIPSSMCRPWRWQYRPRNPPPLLSTCVESRNEALRAHKSDEERRHINRVTGCKWIRYDYDIVHLKDLDVAEACEYVTDVVIVNGLIPHNDLWVGRPECFEHIEALAVSRDLLLHSGEDYANIIRHFFPKLRLLIVLIDDEYTVHVDWANEKKGFMVLGDQRPDENDVFYTFECNDRCLQRRQALVHAAIGAFRRVLNNHQYWWMVKCDMNWNFRDLEENWDEYVAPTVRVMSYSLPESFKRGHCGRLPIPDSEVSDSDNCYWLDSEDGDDDSEEEPGAGLNDQDKKDIEEDVGSPQNDAVEDPPVDS